MIIVMIVMMIDINLDISWSFSARSNRYHDIDGWLYLPTWPWGKVDKTCAQFWRQQQMVVIVIVLMMMVVVMMTVMVLVMLMVMVMMTVIVVTMVSKRLNYGVNNRWLSSSGSRRCHHKDAKRLNGSNNQDLHLKNGEDGRFVFNRLWGDLDSILSSSRQRVRVS